VALSACERRSREPEPLPAEAPPSAAARVRVVEAHSLVIDGQRVRLSNADAPELFPGARCWAEGVLAKQAFFTVSDAVQNGRTVLLRPLGRENRWGQALAEVTIDDVNLGDLLYEQGLASRPTGHRFNWCAEVDPNAPGAPTLTPLFAAGRR
jgi:endonuclease YncB( thermonuclease family)